MQIYYNNDNNDDNSKIQQATEFVRVTRNDIARKTSRDSDLFPGPMEQRSNVTHPPVPGSSFYV